MPIKTETTLAIDPGMRELGFAALAGEQLLDSGVLSLRHRPPKQRLNVVRDRLERWIGALNPTVLVLEVIPKRSLETLGGLPALGRLLRRVAKRHSLEVVTYSAKSVRRSLLGDGWAGKADVAKRLVGRHPELKVYRGQTRKWKESHWQNLFDALALAHHHQSQTHPPSRGR